MRDIVLVVHDIRSTHNVGALLRTCDGLGISQVYLTGYTPFPKKGQDKRLPHIISKLDKQINKTALGAEHSVSWQQSDNVDEVIVSLERKGYKIIGLEQTKDATKLQNFDPPEKVALVLGSEVEGISQELLKKCDIVLEIPMLGKKESFNVVEAASMALYHFRYSPFKKP